MNGSSKGSSSASEVVVLAAEEQHCKIIYIPDKPPVPPHLQPTVSVHAAVIEPKYANTLVRKLNQIAPLENLRHVKRVRKQSQDGDKTELSVILCLASESDSRLDGVPNDVLELIKQYQLSMFVAKVFKYAASTKTEWDEQCKFWPTSYHPPTYNISGITGFSKEETKMTFGFMKYAVDLAKSSFDLGGDDENIDGKTNILHSDSTRPYLCTGYDIYLVWEPCIMCAMALVHQRVKRIFYALPNPNDGALGSIHRLQGERSLNHHYAVFRVILPEEMSEYETLISSNSENYQVKI